VYYVMYLWSSLSYVIGLI